jgi:hypothetical protein
MNEEHRRSYDADVEIPRWLKWTFSAIDRVGFPIVAFGLMWWMASNSMNKIVVAVEQNTIVLMEVKDTLMRLDRK